LPGQFAHAEVVQAYETVIAACRKHGKWPGIGGVYAEDLLAKYVALGMRMIIAGNDLGLLMAGANERAKFLRGQLP
jgi:4-hydroxy-2-oxoheptanedioate aldolase